MLLSAIHGEPRLVFFFLSTALHMLILHAFSTCNIDYISQYHRGYLHWAPPHKFGGNLTLRHQSSIINNINNHNII